MSTASASIRPRAVHPHGGSYGGFIALEYVLAHPDRVTHLILRDTAAANDHQEAAKRNALARAAEFPAITPELLDRMFAGEVYDDEDFRRTFGVIAPLLQRQL